MSGGSDLTLLQLLKTQASSNISSEYWTVVVVVVLFWGSPGPG